MPQGVELQREFKDKILFMDHEAGYAPTALKVVFMPPIVNLSACAYKAQPSPGCSGSEEEHKELQ